MNTITSRDFGLSDMVALREMGLGEPSVVYCQGSLKAALRIALAVATFDHIVLRQLDLADMSKVGSSRHSLLSNKSLDVFRDIYPNQGVRVRIQGLLDSVAIRADFMFFEVG